MASFSSWISVTPLSFDIARMVLRFKNHEHHSKSRNIPCFPYFSAKTAPFCLHQNRQKKAAEDLDTVHLEKRHLAQRDIQQSLRLHFIEFGTCQAAMDSVSTRSKTLAKIVAWHGLYGLTYSWIWFDIVYRCLSSYFMAKKSHLIHLKGVDIAYTWDISLSMADSMVDLPWGVNLYTDINRDTMG